MTSIGRLSVELQSYPGLDERITILRAGDEVDAVFVRTERFNILVDTLSTPDLCQQVLDLIGSELDRRPLLVVNSHMDWDHYWGNCVVAGRAPIIAHETAHRRFYDPANIATLMRKAQEEERFAGLQHVGPNVSFTGTMMIDGGDLILELLHTPGHTPDHIVVWIPQIRTCLAVDAVEAPIPEVWTDAPSDLAHLRNSLRMISNLNAEFLVLAHGQTADPQTVFRNIAYFDALAQKVSEINGDVLKDNTLIEIDGFGLEDFITLPREMPEATKAFYRKCHETNLRATVNSRLRPSADAASVPPTHIPE
ncbi:MBL fold metallo-hydrolase [Oryzifoliimicrobium ureilyticus]|uniref:MBL fold metallo-hydrolase n=1 Tax=Oryzifoliimicrobium ureilyticus TaxID=3113724 RepID=UPI003076411A